MRDAEHAEGRIALTPKLLYFWVPVIAGFAVADAQCDAAAALPVFTLTHLPPIILQPKALAGVHEAAVINTAQINAAVSETDRRVIWSSLRN
jgi:hypothetical protein